MQVKAPLDILDKSFFLLVFIFTIKWVAYYLRRQDIRQRANRHALVVNGD
jgi:hypothetical protein